MWKYMRGEGGPAASILEEISWQASLCRKRRIPITHVRVSYDLIDVLKAELSPSNMPSRDGEPIRVCGLEVEAVPLLRTTQRREASVLEVGWYSEEPMIILKKPFAFGGY